MLQSCGSTSALPSGPNPVFKPLQQSENAPRAHQTRYKLFYTYDAFGAAGPLYPSNGLLYGAGSGGGGCAGYCGTLYTLTLAGVAKVVHTFDNKAWFPVGSLTSVGNEIYGTTKYGGLYPAACDRNGCGGVYAFNPSTKTVQSIYSFTGGADGKLGGSSANINGGLIALNNRLFGVTNRTLYQITTGGIITILHTFGKGIDGAQPNGGLLFYRGFLWGTTSAGGNSGLGSVFALNASNNHYTLVYSFRGPSEGDGATPQNGLAVINGTIYGATERGGTLSAGPIGCYSVGCGTVFSLSAGVEKVVYSFQGLSSDGQYPMAGVTAASGEIFGTTSYSGSGGVGGQGVAYEVTPAGKETVLHFFQGSTDGCNPILPMTYFSGLVYGITSGSCPYRSQSSFGTVFALNT